MLYRRLFLLSLLVSCAKEPLPEPHDAAPEDTQLAGEVTAVAAPADASAVDAPDVVTQ